MDAQTTQSTVATSKQLGRALSVSPKKTGTVLGACLFLVCALQSASASPSKLAAPTAQFQGPDCHEHQHPRSL